MAAPKSLPQLTPLNAQPRGIIIGASAGIGAALARALAAEGYLLALLARREEPLKNLCSELNSQNAKPRAIYYPHDVCDYDSIPLLFQTILKDLKQVDLIVYVAGSMPTVAPAEFSFEKDRTMASVNLLGGQAWLALGATLFSRMGGGHLIGISSVAAERGRVKNPGYNASKAGFDTYLEALRNRLSRLGVHVMTVRPGVVDTELSREVGGPMMVAPEVVARDIVKGLRKRKQVVYSPRSLALDHVGRSQYTLDPIPPDEFLIKALS